MTDNQFPIYDEDEAITFIRATLPVGVSELFTDNDLMEILDAIWDYYDATGATSLDNINEDEDEFPDPKMVAENIIKPLSKNGPKAINIENLTLIVKGEIAYEEDLGSRI